MGSRSRYDATILRDAARDLEFSVQPTGSYRLVQSGARRGLIELVEVTRLEEYCARLERALGLPRNAVPRPPSHVTLFTEPGGGGIGLDTPAEMAALSCAITDPVELATLACARSIWAAP